MAAARAARTGASPGRLNRGAPAAASPTPVGELRHVLIRARSRCAHMFASNTCRPSDFRKTRRSPSARRRSAPDGMTSTIVSSRMRAREGSRPQTVRRCASTCSFARRRGTAARPTLAVACRRSDARTGCGRARPPPVGSSSSRSWTSTIPCRRRKRPRRANDVASAEIIRLEAVRSFGDSHNRSRLDSVSSTSLRMSFSADGGLSPAIARRSALRTSAGRDTTERHPT